jgi:hypothetical protein
VSANTLSTYEFTINQIVLSAYRIASQMAIEEPASGVQWDQRVQFGYQCLEMVMKRIEAQGKLVRARKFLFIPMVADQLEYSVGSDIMDVFGDGAFIQPGDDVDAPVGTVPVKQMDMEMWQRISSTGATGQIPTMYMTYRAADPITVRVWPVPTTGTQGTIRFQAYRFLGQNNDGTKNPDLERYWANYLVYAVGALIAEAANSPPEKVLRLEGKAAELLIEAKSYSHQRTPGQAVVTHRGPYAGGRRLR